MATPSPSPSVAEGADGTLALAGAEFVLGAGLFLTSAAVVSIVLYRTARFQPASMVAVSVSILTLTALFAATAVGDGKLGVALISIASTGIGGLVGALTTLVKERHDAAENRGGRDDREAE